MAERERGTETNIVDREHASFLVHTLTHTHNANTSQYTAVQEESGLKYENDY